MPSTRKSSRTRKGNKGELSPKRSKQKRQKIHDSTILDKDSTVLAAQSPCEEMGQIVSGTKPRLATEADLKVQTQEELQQLFFSCSV